MATWEQILLGIAAVIMLFFFWPGIRKMLKQSQQAENKDWQGALMPIGIVVIFVILMIIVARS